LLHPRNHVLVGCNVACSQINFNSFVIIIIIILYVLTVPRWRRMVDLDRLWPIPLSAGRGTAFHCCRLYGKDSTLGRVWCYGAWLWSTRGTVLPEEAATRR